MLCWKHAYALIQTQVGRDKEFAGSVFVAGAPGLYVIEGSY